MRMLAKDPEKSMRVVPPTKGIGTTTLNKLLEKTSIALPGKLPSVKNHLHADKSLGE